MKYLATVLVLVAAIIIAFAVWIWSGAYNIAADSPHWSSTRYLIGQLRERSIEARIDDIEVPDLSDPALIELGAHHYARMCTGCHLAPGMQDSDLRTGLYPKPPNLTRFSPSPAEAFWVIKHGIKMTAMPAWGKTHDDHKIWAMVAYLQKQPDMSVPRYRQLAGLDRSSPGHHDHGHENGHDHGHGHDHTASAPGKSAQPATPASAMPPAHRR